MIRHLVICVHFVEEILKRRITVLALSVEMDVAIVKHTSTV